MDYPPCPYPPRVPGDGIPVGETRLPQKPPNAECATACPQEDALTGLDWHRPSSGTLIHSPHQINNVSAESCVLSSLNLPQPTRFSPPEVALPSSPERKEIVLVSSASTFTGDEDSISSINISTSSCKVTGAKRAYDETVQSRSSTAAGYNAESVRQIQKNPKPKPLTHRKIQRTVSASRRDLSKPFRSPLRSANTVVVKTTPSPQHTSVSIDPNETSVPPSTSCSQTGGEDRPAKPHLHSPFMTMKNAVAASKPFKSPLATSHFSASRPASDRRKIQLVEKKLTTLRQARKYRLDGSTKHLQELTQKWKAAAREAAQELWTLAQIGFSNASTDEYNTAVTPHDDDGWKSWGYGNEKEDEVLAVLKGGSKGREFAGNWGWDDAETTLVEEHEQADFLSSAWEPPSPATLSSQLAKPRGRAGGEARLLPSDDSDQVSGLGPMPDTKIVGGRHPDADSEETDELEAKDNQRNIGTMLVQLGIAKETLGWNDAEEDFVD